MTAPFVTRKSLRGAPVWILKNEMSATAPTSQTRQSGNSSLKSLRDATAEFDAYSAHRKYFARVRDAAPLNRLLYVDLKTFLPCLNLITTDKTSMAANLEVRVPFLNREMIELAATMPPEFKLPGFKRKYILKRALEKVLPFSYLAEESRLRRSDQVVVTRPVAPDD